MRILYHLPSIHSMYAGRFIGLGYRDACIDLGYKFQFVDNTTNVLRVAQQFSPDLFITSSHRICTDHIDWDSLSYLRTRGMCVAVQVDRLSFPEDESHSLVGRPDILKRIQQNKFGDIYFNYYQKETMREFEQISGCKYHTILLAANRLVHYPTGSDIKHTSDGVFIGAYLPRKRHTFSKLLQPLRRKYKIRIYGPDWTIFDRAVGFIQRSSQYLNIRIFDRLRAPLLTQDEERSVYASTRIGINIHENQQRTNGEDFNERTFKILACGTFQLCDRVDIIRKYFTSSELVMARDDDWQETFEYYLTHERERMDIQERGTRKVHEAHTYHHRVAQIVDLRERWLAERAFVRPT